MQNSFDAQMFKYKTVYIINDLFFIKIIGVQVMLWLPARMLRGPSLLAESGFKC